MPIWLHIILAVLITAYFVFRFFKDKQFYELLFVIWVPSTLLQYVSSNPTFIKVLSIFQIAMFISVIFFMFRKRGASRQKTAQILANYATGDLDKVMEQPTVVDEDKVSDKDSEENIKNNNNVE